MRGPVYDPATRSALDIERLRSFGALAALHHGPRTISYAELADLVEQRAAWLGSVRSLVALEGDRSVDFVVTLLAALHGQHPLIVLDGPSPEIVATYEPSVIVAAGQDPVRRITEGSRPVHPDLALLLSTSGSTGANKLVRLSHNAVHSNASAIAQYLELTPDDCGVTSLPLHYCYGLSVLTSHLAAGAAIVLTDKSVVDPCFVDAMDRHGVTGLAGVPYSFEMLERGDDAALRSSDLRYVTQAGGRLPVESALRLHDLGADLGWDFFVMYGQTEATARIAYLPPELGSTHPRSVGRAIPGGSIRIDPVDGAEAGVGEVVYRGPNVMMGYAQSISDLTRGADIDELRTGDLGFLDDHDMLTIVGRSSRFVKIHGKRIDLDHLEARLAARGSLASCVGDDAGIVAAIEDDTLPPGVAVPDADLAREVSQLGAVPLRSVTAARCQKLPRTSAGKVAQAALMLLRDANATNDSPAVDSGVADIFASILGVADVEPSDTFAGLGGDSLSYVEASIRLESMLGHVHAGWHLMSVADLETRRTRRSGRRRWIKQVETGVVIRAIAIMLIVCTHMRVFRLAGGAHALLAVAGWNFARFHLLPHDVPNRLRRAAASIGRLAVPASAWVGINMLVVGGYSIGALFLVNNYTGSAVRDGGRWEYWYFEAFVQIAIVLSLVFAVAPIRRLERRSPFAFALALLGATWLIRFEVVSLGGAYNEIFRPHTVFVFFVVGWCAQRASTVAQRLLVTAIAAVSTFGFFETVGYFDQFDREARIMVMIAALIWLPTVRLPEPLAYAIGKIAAASMYIFLVHWQIYPALTPIMSDRIAFWLTIAAGVGVWFAVQQVLTAVQRLRNSWRQRRAIGASTNNQVSPADRAMSKSDVTPVSA